MAIEKVEYKVISKEGNFEIRLYEPMIIAVTDETNLRGERGFNQLFRYISGDNSESKKISMTSPVLNSIEENVMKMAFIMPPNYKLEDLPLPGSSNLKLEQIAGRHVAALRFPGNINETKINKGKHELLEWVKQKNLTVNGSVELARYNPPFIPGFLKRNELLVEILLS